MSEWISVRKNFLFFFFIKTSTKIECACVRLVMFYLLKWAAPLCVWHTSCCVFIYEPELLDFEHSLELFWLEPPVFHYIPSISIYIKRRYTARIPTHFTPLYIFCLANSGQNLFSFILIIHKKKFFRWWIRISRDVCIFFYQENYSLIWRENSQFCYWN